jgi:TRAP-type C4-dicarboxylate transport system permease small subunit
MQKLFKVCDRITLIFIRISTLIIIFLVLVMVANIISRSLFNAPISGTVEIVEFGMLVCIALAVSRTGLKGRHIYVSVVQDALPRKAKAVLKCFCMLISAVVFGSLTVRFLQMLPPAVTSGRVTDVLRMPYWYVYVVLIIAMILGCLTFLYQAVLAMIPFFQKEEMRRNNPIRSVHCERKLLCKGALHI